MAVLALTFVVTGVFFWRIPKGFLPTEDTGQIVGFTEAGQDISFDGMVRHQQEVAEITRRDPAVAALMSSVGVDQQTGNVVPNMGRLFIRLKPRSERAPVDEVVERLRRELSGVLGMTVYLQVPPPVTIGGAITKAPYQYTAQSTDLEELTQWAPVLYEKIRLLPGLEDRAPSSWCGAASGRRRSDASSPRILIGWADPFVGSKIAIASPKFAPGASPRPPIMPAQRSERTSP